MSDIRRAKRSSGHAQEEVDYRLIFGIAFMAFLVGAIVSRVMPWRAGAREAGRAHSVFAQARAAADRIVPFAFMG
jgi:hypothetical protein